MNQINDMFELTRWMNNAEAYATDLVAFFKEKLAQGFSEYEIKAKIADKLRNIMKEKNIAQLDKEVSDCKNPGCFIITSYLCFACGKDSMNLHARAVPILYEKIRELAPEFLGPNEHNVYQLSIHTQRSG